MQSKRNAARNLRNASFACPFHRRSIKLFQAIGLRIIARGTGEPIREFSVLARRLNSSRKCPDLVVHRCHGAGEAAPLRAFRIRLIAILAAFVVSIV